ncbi:MAG: preprotein translocase subunit SecA [Akkermansiaceae bacterium]|nr:preprotein translocase subunit SecA [Akkermansiaceae bacterium]
MTLWPFPNLSFRKDDREVQRLRPVVARIHRAEAQLQELPDEALRERTRAWQAELARYHPLDAPPRPRLERMTPAELERAAAQVNERFAPLRSAFSGLPRKVEAGVDSIDAAARAFHEIEPRFAKAREKFLEGILPEAYAVVMNAARRLCGREIDVCGRPERWEMVHFDVQLMGGAALHRGLIAEMQTGEGKTLVATLPVYLNALAGLGAHVVTVNDYLAKRDADWMGALFRMTGLTVGCIQGPMEPDERRAAYACDITYGTSTEFGFDYLRDNGIAVTKDEQVQRGHHFAVVDEVDSVLIDEARTPLIITGPARREVDPFSGHKALVEALVKKQTALCNRLADEVEQHLRSSAEGDAGDTLFSLKLGQPRNRRFLRFMEKPELRRLLEKTELSYRHGTRQRRFLELRNRLFYVVDEKEQEADLTEKGRTALSPDDPDSFTLPDVGEVLPGTTEGRDAMALLHARAGRIHAITQLLKAYSLYERDVHYVVRDGEIIIVDQGTGREMEGRRWSDGLHQAVEAREGLDTGSENRTYATITIQNYFRLYDRLSGMTGTASTASSEFHDIYGLDVLPIPTNRPCIRIDESDAVYRTRREKYNAVVARIAAEHATGRPVLVGTASVEASETLSRMLKRARIPHSVLNAKWHQREAEIVSRAGQRGAVTVSTNMAGRGTDIKLAEGVAELGGLLVIATERHESRRVDRQLRGRCSRQGDPGGSRCFLSLEDELIRNHVAPERLADLIERRGPVGRWTFVEDAQQKVEQRDYRARKRVLEFDDVMNIQREIVYGLRNEAIHAGDTRDLMHEVLRDAAELSEGTDGGIPTVDDYEANMVGLAPEVRERIERRGLIASIDSHWQEHLEDMEELREGVYLRAQGQKDPLVEFKREAFDQFALRMAEIRADSVRRIVGITGHLRASKAAVA